ncbi:MAG: acyltransferase [Phycisphaeraceae bacterium]|nr:acyltransferase [Phycisphaeraceae bacterium]
MPQGEIRELSGGSFIREKMHGEKQSKRAMYQSLVTGKTGLLALLHYELVTGLFGRLPGALGLVLRKMFFKRLFRGCGGGLVIGSGVTIRHGDKITLGRNVVIDDECVLDARGAGDEGLVIGDNVIISRGCTIQCKSGPISIGDNSNIGSHTLICAMGGVRIGSYALIAGSCSISGGQYHSQDPDKPIMQQGIFTRGPVVIGDGAWLGMKVLVLDAVSIGPNAIIGSGAVVTKDVPDRAVAVGVPAKVIQRR